MVGLPGLCGVGEHDAPCSGPSSCWLVSESLSRAAGTSGLELYEKRQRVSRHGHPWYLLLSGKWTEGKFPQAGTWLK